MNQDQRGCLSIEIGCVGRVLLYRKDMETCDWDYSKIISRFRVDRRWKFGRLGQCLGLENGR